MGLSQIISDDNGHNDNKVSFYFLLITTIWNIVFLWMMLEFLGKKVYNDGVGFFFWMNETKLYRAQLIIATTKIKTA